MLVFPYQPAILWNSPIHISFFFHLGKNQGPSCPLLLKLLAGFYGPGGTLRSYPALRSQLIFEVFLKITFFNSDEQRTIHCKKFEKWYQSRRKQNPLPLTTYFHHQNNRGRHSGVFPPRSFALCVSLYLVGIIPGGRSRNLLVLRHISENLCGQNTAVGCCDVWGSQINRSLGCEEFHSFVGKGGKEKLGTCGPRSPLWALPCVMLLEILGNTYNFDQKEFFVSNIQPII